MINVIVINIEWQLIQFNNHNIEQLTKETDFGVYQIYGYHPAYGKDSLLYIGKANNNFSARLKNRFEIIESCATPSHIRIGRLVNSKDDNKFNIPAEMTNKYIDIAERILIKTHSPAFNKQDNTGIFDSDGIDGMHYIVLNWEDFGCLLPETSTLRYSYNFWGFEEPIAK